MGQDSDKQDFVDQILKTFKWKDQNYKAENFEFNGTLIPVYLFCSKRAKSQLLPLVFDLLLVADEWKSKEKEIGIAIRDELNFGVFSTITKLARIKDLVPFSLTLFSDEDEPTGFCVSAHLTGSTGYNLGPNGYVRINGTLPWTTTEVELCSFD